MVAAALREAGEIGVPETVCVVDEGGHPMALERMDGARITARRSHGTRRFTAAGHKRSTHLFNRPPTGLRCLETRHSGFSGVSTGNSAIFVEVFRSS